MRKSTSDVMASSWLGQYGSEKKNSQFALGLKALGSWAGPLGDLSDVAGGGLVVLGEGESALADNIGNFGTALTVIQLFGSYYRTRVCQNRHTLVFIAKPRLSQARALLCPGFFVPLDQVF